MSGVHEQRPVVISYSEIIGLFVTFTLLLYLLNPKEMLEKQVLAESRNYDLTALYLKNMLQQDPSNTTLMLALAKTAYKSGNYDLALQLLGVVRSAKGFVDTAETLQLNYHILKSLYPYQNSKKQQETKATLARVLQQIMSKVDNKMSKRDWYQEALWLGETKEAYRIIHEALHREPNALYWLKQCYDVGIQLNKKDDVKSCLDRVIQSNIKDKEEWLAKAYYLVQNETNSSEADTLLKQLETYSPKWSLERAKLALKNHHYQEASRIYLNLTWIHIINE